MIGIDSHGTPIQVEFFAPASASNGGAIIVAHGSDGMNEPWAGMIHEYATELAGKGFTVLIPHYLEKTVTTPGPQVFSEMRKNLPSWEEAVNDTIAHTKTMPGISPSQVGLLGFSLGGHLCLRLRASAQAVVEFFAPELVELGGIGSAGGKTPRVQIHHGLADLLVPFSDTEDIVVALKREGTAAEVFSYEGAGHGFAGTDPNNSTARSSSKARTLDFFQKYL